MISKEAEVLRGALVQKGLLASALFFGAGCGSSAQVHGEFSDAEWAQLKKHRLSAEGPPKDVTNRFADDDAARAFGQKLFFYEGFAGPLLESDNDGSAETLGSRGESGRVSCAGCHVPESGFVDSRSPGKQVSLASGWTLRKTPSLYDVAQKKLFTWGGQADSLQSQIFGVIENDHEMNSSRLFVAETVFREFRADYEAIFGAMPELSDASRFPVLRPEEAGCDARAPMAIAVCRGRPGDGAAYDGMTAADQAAVTRVVINVGKAIGAYQRKLTCGPSRFDRFIGGDEEALSDEEKAGARLFVGKGKCAGCHSGPYFSDFRFHNVGLAPTTVAVAIIDKDDDGALSGFAKVRKSELNSQGAFSDGDDGRLPSEPTAKEEGAFVTPMLRCAGERPSFMHTGQLRTLGGVVEFFAQGGNKSGYLGKSELSPLELTDQEKEELVQFLLALDGDGPAAELLSPPK